MKTKKEIVKDWITRYTGVEISDFGEYILLTNSVSFIPYSILNSSIVLSYDIPNKTSLQKIKKHSFDMNTNINLKSLENNISEPQYELKISKYIANLILNNDKIYNDWSSCMKEGINKSQSLIDGMEKDVINKLKVAPKFMCYETKVDLV